MIWRQVNILCSEILEKLGEALRIIYLWLLKALVRSCRRLGMFYYPTILVKYEDADLGTFIWVGIEEIEQFNTTLAQGLWEGKQLQYKKWKPWRY